MEAVGTIVAPIMVLAPRRVVPFAKECSNKIKQSKKLLSSTDGNVGGHKDP